MILFDLSCEKKHVFEAWFPSSSKFEEQRKKNLIKCPYCNSSKIKKSLMAPNININESRKNVNSQVISTQYSKEIEKKIKELKSYINKNSEDVGKNFAEEARRIYYGETKSRSIRGETTLAEAKELIDEGVPVTKLPWGKREDA